MDQDHVAPRKGAAKPGLGAAGTAPPQPRFSRRFWPLFAFGLLGVATLPLTMLPAIRAGGLPEGMPDLPLPVLVALLMINPILLLAGATALGAWLAPKLGLVSVIAAVPRRVDTRWRQVASAAPLAIGMGLGLALVTPALDLVFQPFLPPQWLERAGAMAHADVLPRLLTGLFYGAITEEILLRWGALSFLAWAGWRLFQRRRAAPTPALMWLAIGLAALLFGVGHLPAAAAIAPLDAVLVARTVLLNALAGLAFGWLFWRRHLEAAMLAHASTHVGFALLAWSGVL